MNCKSVRTAKLYICSVTVVPRPVNDTCNYKTLLGKYCIIPRDQHPHRFPNEAHSSSVCTSVVRSMRLRTIWPSSDLRCAGAPAPTTFFGVVHTRRALRTPTTTTTPAAGRADTQKIRVRKIVLEEKGGLESTEKRDGIGYRCWQTAN